MKSSNPCPFRPTKDGSFFSKCTNSYRNIYQGSGADERFTRQRRALLIPAFNWWMTFSTDVKPTRVAFRAFETLASPTDHTEDVSRQNCPMAAMYRALAGSYRKDVTWPFLFVVNRFVPSYCVEELQYCLTKSQVARLRRAIYQVRFTYGVHLDR